MLCSCANRQPLFQSVSQSLKETSEQENTNLSSSHVKKSSPKTESTHFSYIAGYGLVKNFVKTDETFMFHS